MITISIVGPESTGKTSLAKALANHYQAKQVPEYARTYLNKLGGPYQYEDLSKIARGQVELQNKARSQGNEVVIFDTDLLVIKIWSEYKYGKVDSFIKTQLSFQQPDLYLLTHFDMPYEEDPLREHPNQRPELFDIYKSELEQMGTPFIVVKGDEQKRLDRAISEINNLD